VKYFVYIIKGVVIGIATLVPGVSGGTMAIILGVYDDIIHSISSFFKDMKKNIIFLGTVGIGGVIGLFAFSGLMELALEHFRFPMVYLFIGVIIGGIPVLYKKASAQGIKALDWIFFVIGLAIILVMSLYDGTIVNLANSTGVLQFIFLFFAGIVIAVALILPGLSTSFMLLAIGLYEITLSAISTRNLGYLIPLGLGTVTGILGTTRLLENCMKKKPKQTYLLILGFVIGSIADILLETGLPAGLDIVLSIAALLLGFVVIRMLSEKFSEA
jgi:putative membrane protein